MSKNEYLNPKYVYNFNEIIESDVSNYDNLTEDFRHLIGKIDKQSFLKKLRHSIDVVENALNQCTPNADVCIAFNGGKDCCIVLYLYYVISTKLRISNVKLNILLIELTKQFDELDHFNRDLFEIFYSKEHCNVLKVSNYQMKMKECLRQFKTDNPNILYILMGTRRGDSEYARKLKDFHETDPDWPYFVRVNPILDWTYSELWYFIRRLNIPYCHLYDMGYTSLGDPSNTIKNEALLDSNNNTYRPAYMLEDEHVERNSRI